MIRSLNKTDIDIVCNIINDNWKSVYKGYINEELLSDDGCKARKERLSKDFISNRLQEYVWDEDGQVLAIMSIGDTADTDKDNAFEVWRIYVAKKAQGRGIGSKLIEYAEKEAKKNNYDEIVIWAFSNNIKAISFYNMHGYVADKKEHFDAPFNADATRLIKNI